MAAQYTMQGNARNEKVTQTNLDGDGDHVDEPARPWRAFVDGLEAKRLVQLCMLELVIGVGPEPGKGL